MAKIIRVEIVDDTMRTTYDDGYFNEVVIPKGYKIQVRIVKDTEMKEIRHYKYAKCSTAAKSISPMFVYSVNETTCKTCKIAIKANLLLC